MAPPSQAFQSSKKDTGKCNQVRRESKGAGDVWLKELMDSGATENSRGTLSQTCQVRRPRHQPIQPWWRAVCPVLRQIFQMFLGLSFHLMGTWGGGGSGRGSSVRCWGMRNPVICERTKPCRLCFSFPVRRIKMLYKKHWKYNCTIEAQFCFRSEVEFEGRARCRFSYFALMEITLHCLLLVTCGYLNLKLN